MRRMLLASLLVFAPATFGFAQNTVRMELQGASLYMFQSNEADVLREIRAFAATLTGR
jgi:hypothetical protein